MISRIGEALKVFMIFGGPLVIFSTVALVAQSDWWREWRDPQSFWAKKVEDREYWVKFYGDDSRKCDEDLAKLREAESHQIWTAQRKLDGDTLEEAESNYAEEVRIRIFICDMWRKLAVSSRSDLEKAKAHLSKLQSR